jgi:hypothetical protein
MERVPSIRKLAEMIRAAGFDATVERGYCNTDRHPRGVRWRIPGKGRHGNKLIVRRDGAIVLSHNSAETYRHNAEIVDWMIENGVPVPQDLRRLIREKYHMRLWESSEGGGR